MTYKRKSTNLITPSTIFANKLESTRLSKPLLANTGSKKKNPIAKASERINIKAIDPLPNSSSSPAAILAE